MSSVPTSKTHSSNDTKSSPPFLRNELVSNNLADFQLRKGLDHLQTDFLAIVGALIGGTIVTIAAVALLADRLDHPKQHEVLADAE